MLMGAGGFAPDAGAGVVPWPGRWASTSPARRVALWRYYGRDQVLSGPPRRSGR